MEQLARVLLGLLALAVLLALITRGPTGVGQLWRAKFLGKTEPTKAAK